MSNMSLANSALGAHPVAPGCAFRSFWSQKMGMPQRVSLQLVRPGATGFSSSVPPSRRPATRGGPRATLPCAFAAGAGDAANAGNAGNFSRNGTYRSKAAADIRVLVVGATGYIGKYVVRELVKRGYDVVAMAREKSGIGGKASKEDTIKEFAGAEVVFGDVTDVESLKKVGFAADKKPVDVVVSCLASRTGGIKDSNLIDYQATANAMNAGRQSGAQHFVLLSAICVQKPLLEFQRAKLKFEKELMEAGDITYSIVRPTAFFKSLAAQVEIVKDGAPYVMFGDGKLAACKPISERDLASFIADCVVMEDKKNKLLPIGGPGEALTALDQGQMLFDLTGKKPWFFPVPVAVMDGAIGLFDWLASIFPSLEDSAEFAKIGKYYAVESMLQMDANGRYSADLTPSYGEDTLEDFFKDVLENGLAGQELGDQAVFGINKD